MSAARGQTADASERKRNISYIVDPDWENKTNVRDETVNAGQTKRTRTTRDVSTLDSEAQKLSGWFRNSLDGLETVRTI